jgi:hypothetical protein
LAIAFLLGGLRAMIWFRRDSSDFSIIGKFDMVVV